LRNEPQKLLKRSSRVQVEPSPAGDLGPFDVDYRPDVHPVGAMAIRHMTSCRAGVSANPRAIWSRDVQGPIPSSEVARLRGYPRPRSNKNTATRPSLAYLLEFQALPTFGRLSFTKLASYWDVMKAERQNLAGGRCSPRAAAGDQTANRKLSTAKRTPGVIEKKGSPLGSIHLIPAIRDIQKRGVVLTPPTRIDYRKRLPFGLVFVAYALPRKVLPGN
jgi:hypothetical protein